MKIVALLLRAVEDLKNRTLATIFHLIGNRTTLTLSAAKSADCEQGKIPLYSGPEAPDTLTDTDVKREMEDSVHDAMAAVAGRQKNLIRREYELMLARKRIAENQEKQCLEAETEIIEQIKALNMRFEQVHQNTLKAQEEVERCDREIEKFMSGQLAGQQMASQQPVTIMMTNHFNKEIINHGTISGTVVHMEKNEKIDESDESNKQMSE